MNAWKTRVYLSGMAVGAVVVLMTEWIFQR